MTFLGYRRYDEARPTDAADGDLVPVTGSGLGILRDRWPDRTVDDLVGRTPTAEPRHLLLTQASAGSALTRDVPPFEVRVRILGPDGRVTRRAPVPRAC